MRLVLDTNILISALITKGTSPDSLYQAWLNGEIEVVTTNVQIAELRRVLARPKLKRFIRAEEVATMLQHIDGYAHILADVPEVEISSDPDDNPIVAAAIAGNVDMIVSGDKKHMLVLGEVQGIPVMNARDAAKKLT